MSDCTLNARRDLAEKFGARSMFLLSNSRTDGEVAGVHYVDAVGEPVSFLVDARALFDELNACPELAERVSVRTDAVNLDRWLPPEEL